MSDRVNQLVRELDLVPHPEGGYFRETYRSAKSVTKGEHGERSALTSIYFLVVAGSPSRWHRHGSDEIWHFYEGAPLTLLDLDPGMWELRERRLGPLAESANPELTVEADFWQAARTTGEYTLVGCTVGPGFEFSEFSLLRDDPKVRERIETRYPAYKDLI